MRNLAVAQQFSTPAQVPVSAAVSFVIVAVALMFCFGKKKKGEKNTIATGVVANDAEDGLQPIEKTSSSTTEPVGAPDRYLKSLRPHISTKVIIN